jgi:xylan 1,4-beta-xylosidase
MEIRVDLTRADLATLPELKRPWQRLICAGRAHEGLRAAWREQLRRVQDEIGFDYIRFHGLFMDEMMVYSEREDGSAVYNWRYVDDLFDFLLATGIRPFVELAFMPAALATDEKTIFWWKGRMSPPSSYDRWGELVEAFVRHCIARYGLAEVREWYFEVWNEANLKDWFFSGDQADYFKLYDASAAALRRVDARLRVGGPASSNYKDGEAPWVRDLIEHCRQSGTALDFVSVHPYPNTFPLTHGGGFKECYRAPGSTTADLRWARETLDAAGLTDTGLHVTEWNVSPNPRDLVHDTAFMAPFVIRNALESDDVTDSLGFWVFTDIFEETAAGIEPFHGGFGLINHHGIPKPAYHGFRFLSQLGDYELGRGPGWIVTADLEYSAPGISSGAPIVESVQILLYNYVHFNDLFAGGDRTRLQIADRYDVFEEAEPVEVAVSVQGAGPFRATEETVSRVSGSAYDAWEPFASVAGEQANHLTLSEEAVLRRASVPDTRLWFVEGPNFELTRRLEPHEARLIALCPTRVAGEEYPKRRNQ